MTHASRRGFFRLLALSCGSLSLEALAKETPVSLEGGKAARKAVTARGLEGLSEAYDEVAWQPLVAWDAQQSETYLNSIGVDPGLFVFLWQAVLGTEDSRESERGQSFLSGLAWVLRSSSDRMREEVAMLSSLLDRFWGRALLLGTFQSLADLNVADRTAALEEMAGSVFSFRRQARTGLVTLIGIGHYAHPALAGETGYPGVPPHVLSLWKDETVREEEEAR